MQAKLTIDIGAGEIECYVTDVKVDQQMGEPMRVTVEAVVGQDPNVILRHQPAKEALPYNTPMQKEKEQGNECIGEHTIMPQLGNKERANS